MKFAMHSTLAMLVGMNLLVYVELFAHKFKRVIELDNRLVAGPFVTQSHMGSSSDLMCAQDCMENRCISFIHKAKTGTCYFYKRPLTASSPSVAIDEESVAYVLVDEDLFIEGESLYHPIPERSEAWVVSLQETHDGSEAKEYCLQNGGVLLPLSDSSPYEKFNDLVNHYPGILMTGSIDYYWVGVSDAVVEGTWVNLDGTAATLTWHENEPTPHGDCGCFFHNDGLNDTSFKLGDRSCLKKHRQICLFKF